MSTRGQIRTLWPLPGGAGQYLCTLHWILTAAQDAITTDDLSAALVARFGLKGERTGISYLRVVHGLGLLDIVGQSIYQTVQGRQYLETHDAAVVRHALFTRIDGCTAIVELLEERPLKIGRIRDLMSEHGYGYWQTDSQLRYRLRWLEEVGVVCRGRGTRPEYELVEAPNQ